MGWIATKITHASPSCMGPHRTLEIGLEIYSGGWTTIISDVERNCVFLPQQMTWGPTMAWGRVFSSKLIVHEVWDSTPKLPRKSLGALY